MKLIGTLLLTAFTFSGYFSMGAYAQEKPIEWRMQVSFAATAPVYPHFERFRDEIRNRSKGRLAIKLFPNFGLEYKGADPVLAVSDGLMEMCHDNLNAYTGVMPILEVGNLPLLFNDDKEHAKALEALRPFYEREFRRHNSKMVWFSALPLVHVFARKPILKAEEFKGMKIRVAAKPVMSVMTKLGASPQTIALAEAITAMQTGVIDGQIWSTEAGLSWKIQDVVHFASSWPFYGVEQAIFLNQKKFDALPPDLQKVVTDVGREYETVFTNTILLGEDKSRKDMEATGKMKFFAVDKSEIAKARAVSKAVWDEWAKKAGPTGTEAIKAIEKALGR